MGPDARSVCDRCDGETVVRPVPDGCRGLLADDPPLVRLCERCLDVLPAPGTPVTRDWDPATVSESLPTDPAAAVAVALLVTLLGSMALNRSKIERVVDYLEVDAGVDPLLAIQRVRSDDLLQPAADLGRREPQLAQVLDAQR